MIALLLVACTLELEPDPEDPAAAPLVVPDLWTGEVPSNGRVVVSEAIVISPRTTAGTTFYVQHPGGGPFSGLQVQIGDGLYEDLPPVGTPVELRGTYVLFSGGPTLWLKDRDDLRVLGDPVQPVSTQWSDDPALIWSLVHAANVAVTSSVDPTGIANTSLDVRLRPDFDVHTPGWNRTGDLTGIDALAHAILLRTEDDWTGSWEGDPPVVSTVPGLVDLAHGTPVVITDLLQATPWSEGERYAVLQDAASGGVWVDAEGFGAPASAEGDVGDWMGELRFGGDGLRLRVWTDPELTGNRATLPWTLDPLEAPQGAILDTTVSGLGQIGSRGDRISDNWLLDNRFTPLDALTDPDDVRGVVRVDELGLRRLAILPSY